MKGLIIMTHLEEISVVKQMKDYFDSIYICTKYSIFYNDVLNKHDEMLDAEKKFAEEYLSPLKPKFKNRFIGLFISALILIMILFISDGLYFGHWDFNFYEKVLNTSVIYGAVSSAASTEGIFSLFAAALGMLYAWTTVAFFIFALLLLYSLIKFFFSGYIIAKKKVDEHLAEIEKIYSIENAKNNLKDIEECETLAKHKLESLFNKYNIDGRLRNKENIDYFYEEICKTNDSTIESVQKNIIDNNLIRQTFDKEKWCEILLHYDKDFPYYSNKNPWLENKDKREHTPILTNVFKWRFKMLFSMLGIDEKTIKEEQERRERAEKYKQ